MLIHIDKINLSLTFFDWSRNYTSPTNNRHFRVSLITTGKFMKRVSLYRIKGSGGTQFQLTSVSVERYILKQLLTNNNLTSETEWLSDVGSSF